MHQINLQYQALWAKNTPTYNPPFSGIKECTPLKDTRFSTKSSNKKYNPVKENVSQKSNNKTTPPKTLQLKLNKEDWCVSLLHELQSLWNDICRNHSELGLKVDSNITELKSVQLSLLNLIALPARVKDWRIPLQMYYPTTVNWKLKISY